MLFSHTKWPAHGKPPTQSKNSSHSEQMSAANNKHYEPLPWDDFFDELTYTDDVPNNLLKGTSLYQAGN